MTRLKPGEGTVSVPLDVRLGGGVLDGQLLSLYRCPKCHEDLRFIAVFESAQVAEQAVGGMGDLARKMELVRTGRAIVGTATYMSMYGPRTHGAGRYGYGAYYGGGCSLVPFYGTERELAQEIWGRLNTGDARLPSGRIDLTRLEGVRWAIDAVSPQNPPLVLYDFSLLSRPEDVLVGGWNIGRERYEDWRKRAEKAPHLFLQKLLLSSHTV